VFSFVSGAGLTVNKRQRFEGKSGGQWDAAYLARLKITIEFTEHPGDIIPFNSEEESEKAKEMIHLLKELSYDELVAYPISIRDEGAPAHYFLPIYKAIYLTNKYKDHESAVDCLLGHLLTALGFNDGRLFSFPQLRVPLRFGEDEGKFATADFTIIDVVSFHRVCFCEDKSVKSELLDCGPQIVAEGMALHQLNYCKATAATTSSEANPSHAPVVGVRVSGFRFFFYSIPYSQAVLTAMESQEVPLDGTVVKCFPADGLDFLVRAQRPLIIQLLDQLQKNVAQAGTQSVRRSSKLY
jgi:hypothetical protein